VALTTRKEYGDRFRLIRERVGQDHDRIRIAARVVMGQSQAVVAFRPSFTGIGILAIAFQRLIKGLDRCLVLAGRVQRQSFPLFHFVIGRQARPIDAAS
jgi:hypothetical protein